MDDDLAQPRRQRPAEQLVEHPDRVLRGERLEFQRRGTDPGAPPGSLFEELWPRGRDQQEGSTRVADDSFQEIEQLLLAPVDVLDQHDGGSLRDDLLEELDPRVLEAVTGGEWVEPVGHIQPERQPQDLARAEAFEHHRRRIALEDPEMLLQHLRERPVRDALAIGETPSGPPQRLGRAVTQPFPEFAHDPCLADPRIPEDRYELWFPPVLDLRVGSLEHLHLFVTADECPAKASDTARTHERKSAHEASAVDPSRLPLGLDRLSFPELERATRGRDRSLADEDLARLRGLLQSRCHVHRIARDEGAAFARLADDDLTRVNPDPQRERLAEEFVQTPLHRQRPVKRALGVILER